MGKVTGTLGGNGGFVSATGVIVLTLFTLALLFNAVMPALGMAKSSALCTLLLATLGLVGLVRSRPVFAVSMLYVLAIGMTAFLAGVGLEDGGYLTETDVIGDATGAFSRLLSFYLIFVVCALVAFSRFLDERPVRASIKARITLQPVSIAMGFGNRGHDYRDRRDRRSDVRVLVVFRHQSICAAE